MANIIKVSALNAYVKSLLDSDPVLTDIAIHGEITNFVHHYKSGHYYFSLRDERASVKAVMFSRDARRLAFTPQEGMHVLVRCRVTLFERDGAFQVYVEDMFPDGMGSAQMAFEQLKQRLQDEGLFLAEHKKPLPEFPKCIGLVTSKTGAAIQDILNVAGRRWPASKFLLAPVNVQGQEAAPQIAEAIHLLDQSKRCDVIIVARGGGSREDLWVFNSENIARAAYACKTPLVSAVGHEIDFTILDFVADLRAPTPSAAAELVVPDRQEMRSKLCNLQQNIHNNMQYRWQLCYNEYKDAASARSMERMQQGYLQKQGELQQCCAQLRHTAEQLQNHKRVELAHCAALAHSLSPYQILARGYALLQDDNGHPILPDSLQNDQQFYVRGRRQRARCAVLEAVPLEDADENTQKL